jgi:16S rRNA processing protein RimM
MSGGKRVLLGRVLGAHGLKGEVVIRAFTGAPEAIAGYGPLTDGAGDRTIEIAQVRVTARGVVARIAGISDRTAAEGLKGLELFVDRDRLAPAEEGEFYHADLIGLAAVDPTGRRIGEIVAVQNFGAGDLIEVRLAGSRRTEFVPFQDAFVPTVDLAARRLTVILPASTPDTDDETDAR